MEQSFEALVLVDIETQEVVEVNRRFTEMLGYSLPEDAPLHVNRFGTDSQSNRDSRYKSLIQRRLLPVEIKILRHKNGSQVHVERAGTVINIDGRDYLLASMRDMTMERKRQVELARDAEFAHGVQQELLPDLPESPFVATRILYYPANFVSGDSYILEWCNEGTMLRGFLIDVVGHGLATALQTASINVLLRETAALNLSLLEQVYWINKRAAKYFREDSYAAMFGFEMDLSARELRYVAAGITQFFSNGNKVLTPGMFVGLWNNADFDEFVLPISEGDTFYFLTDGFTDVLAQLENAGIFALDGKDIDAHVTALKKLAEGENLRDDATGICLKIDKLL
jgi:PAS domain S-box-containing protein